MILGMGLGLTSRRPTAAVEPLPTTGVTVSASTYWSTPDSAKLATLGTFAIEMDLALSDWSTGTGLPQVPISQAGVGGEAWFVQFDSTGLLVLTHATGAGAANTYSSVVPSLTNASRYQILIERNTSGAVNFSSRTSPGDSWVAVGTQQTGNAGALIDSTAPLQVGGIYGALYGMGGGTVYRMQVRSALGTIDFYPERDRHGSDTSFTSATGEVWTYNT